MKYILIIVSILALIGSIFVVGANETTQYNENFNAYSNGSETAINESMANETNVSEDDNLIRDERNFVTSNGKDLVIGKILNGNNETVEKEVRVGDIETNITLHPYGEWNYAKTENFIMVPSQSGSLIHNMAYYDKGKQLRAFVDFSDNTDIYIQVKGKSRPERVYVDASFTSWGFNSDTHVVKIRSSFGSLHEVTLGWNDFMKEGPGDVFIEDTKRLEDKLYEVDQIEDKKESLQPVFEERNSTKNEMENKIEQLNNSINNTANLNKQLENNVTETNSTIDSLKNSLSGMIVLTPLKTVLTVLIIVAIILFALSSVFLNGDKNE
ncbi:MAG: hypothetical protein ACOCQD_04420 [archaeon]